MSTVSLLKKPSAFLPIAMSLAALAVVLAHIAIYGAVHETDEGAAAHIWQILMAAQVPIIAYMFLRRIAEVPAQTIKVLGLQVLAALMACAPVYWMEHR